MAKKIVTDGRITHYYKISELLRPESAKKLTELTQARVVCFADDDIRARDVDGDIKEGDTIVVYGIPDSDEEFAALLKFGDAQIITKKKTYLTSSWIWKEHQNEIKPQLADLDPDVLREFASQAIRQIDYAHDSIQKIISYENLDDETKNLICTALSNSLNIHSEDEIDYSSLVCHQYWRKVVFGTKALDVLESKIGQYSSIICKMQMACINALKNPTACSVKNASHCTTELVLSSFGWKGNDNTVDGPYG